MLIELFITIIEAFGNKINIYMKKYFIVLLVSGLVNSLSGQTRFTDPRDGNVYRTISIDSIIWMSENLRYKIPGSGISFFDNDPNNILRYGILYDWKSAMKACPVGWHLPSGHDFQKLIDHYDQDLSLEKTESGSGTFGIQLGGMQDYEGTFSEMDESGYYWTATEYGEKNAEYFSYLIINNAPIIDISRKEDMEDIHGTEKTNKYSLRCIKNR
jgi:uncharacterized protein (TIGR02145 family)